MARHLGVAGAAVYAILAVAWSVIIPLDGGIDEGRHFRHIEIMAQEHRFPTAAEKQEAISHNPPLHYVLAVPAYLLGSAFGEQAKWRALRLWSVILGGLSLWLLYSMLRRIFPEEPRVAQVGLMTVGWLPHFLLVSAMISNDISAILTGTLLLFLATLMITGRAGKWAAALAGLAAGLACLAKHNALVLVPPAFAAVVGSPWLPRRTREGQQDATEGEPPAGRALWKLLAFGAAFALTGGLWLINFYGTWGRLDSDPPWPEAAWPVHAFAPKLLRAVSGLYRSTWSQVGWLPGPHSAPPATWSGAYPRPNLETPLLGLAAPVVLVGVVGSVVCVCRWLKRPETQPRALAVGMLLAAAGLMYATLTHNAMFVNPGRFEGGRYLLPAVAAYMPLLAIGPLALEERWRKVAWAWAAVLLLAMNAIAVVEFYVYLIPTFAPR